MTFQPKFGKKIDTFQPKFGKLIVQQEANYSPEPTPLLIYKNKDGSTGFGIITSNLKSGVGSPYNKDGLDIFAPNGTPIKLPIQGKVISIIDGAGERDRSKGDFGNQIVIEDENTGERHQISHIKAGTFKVKEGDKVLPFQELASVGNSGHVIGPTGNHIDWEVQKDGQNLDINTIRDTYEGKLPKSTMEFFRNPENQLAIQNHIEAIKQFSPEYAKKFDRGVWKGIAGKLSEQMDSIKTIWEEGGKYRPIQERAKDVLIPFKFGWAVIDSLNNAIEGWAESSKKNIKNIPLVLKAIGSALRGEGISLEDQKKINKDSKGAALATANAAVFAIAPEIGKSFISRRLLSPTLSQALGGFVSEKEISEMEGAGKKEAIGRGLLTGLERGGIMSIIKKFFTKQPTKEIIKARREGISERSISALTEEGAASGEQKLTREYLEAQKRAAKTEAPSPTQIVGEDLKQFLKDAEIMMRKTGTKIGDELRKLKFQRQNVDTSPFMKQYRNTLRELNINTNAIDEAGNLTNDAFLNSKIASNTDRTAIRTVWNDLRKTNLKPSDIEAMQSRIGDTLYRGKLPGADVITKAKRPLEAVRQMADKYISGLSKKLKQYKTTYSDLKGIVQQVEKKAGTEGTRAPGLLRRLFGNVPEEAQKLIKNIEDVARKYDIESGKGIYEKTRKARAIESSLPVIKETGLAGQIGSGIRVAEEGALELARPKLGIYKAFKSLIEKPTGILQREAFTKRASTLENLIKRIEQAKPLVTEPVKKPEIIAGAAGIAGATAPQLERPPKIPALLGKISQSDLGQTIKRKAGLFQRLFGK